MTLLALAGCDPDTRSVTVSSGTQFTVEGRDGHPWLYLDLQGILWRLPADGGEAEALTGPELDLRRPRLSPDGTRLLFQSFAGGSWQIGIMSVDGGEPELLTSGHSDHRNPAWVTDNSVVFAADRDGDYDLWSLTLSDGKFTRGSFGNDDVVAPAPPLWGWLSEDKGKARIAWVKQTYPQVDGAITARAGELHPPRVSPDARRIAFVRATERNGFPNVARNELVVQQLQSDAAQVVSVAGADVFTVAPAWWDTDTLLYTADGQIQRVQIATGETTVIPFSAELPLARRGFRAATPLAMRAEKEPLKGLLDPLPLADGRILATALGDLYFVERDGRMGGLTQDAWVERDLALSPDGRQLAYISDRGGSMQVWLHTLDTGEVRQLTQKSSGPRYPTFSPDGTRLAFLQVGPIGTQDFQLRVADLATGEVRRLRQSPRVWPNRIAWSADGTHLTVAELHKSSSRFSYGRNRLVRVNVDEDTADVLSLPDGLAPDFGPVASPDGRRLALILDGALWTVPVAPDGRINGEPIPVLDDLVESPAFTPDGLEIIALTARGLERINLQTGRRALQNPRLTWQPAAPSDKFLVHAGRVFDGLSDTYLENVDIVMDGARIVAVQPHREHPADYRVIDASEHTVVPGLIDHHVHFQPHQGEWVGRAWLAFGVTTVVEPGGLPFESRELMEAWSTARRHRAAAGLCRPATGWPPAHLPVRCTYQLHNTPGSRNSNAAVTWTTAF